MFERFSYIPGEDRVHFGVEGFCICHGTVATVSLFDVRQGSSGTGFR
jgi:hypothetical protein